MKNMFTSLANQSGGLDPSIVMVVIVIAVVLFAIALLLLSRYKKCPSDKIMVIYGKVGFYKQISIVVPMGKSFDFKYAHCFLLLSNFIIN